MIASSENVRRQNRALILASLRDCGSLAHTDISEWTGLSSATVSAITADLLAEDIILKSEASSSAKRGRPRVLFTQNADSAYIAVARITSEEIECSLCDYTGTLKDRFSEKRPSDETNPEEFGKRFSNSLEKLLERSKLARKCIRTISITSKGLVAPGKPVLLWSPVFGDKQVDFEALLCDRWSARIILTNETQFVAQAVANMRKRNNPQFHTQMSASLSLGHNIGLGIATETPGKKITSTAPSFGHMTHAPDGPLCRCGAKGCIEAYAGFYGILRSAFEVPAQTIPANFVPLEEIDKIADNARYGDRMSQFAFRQAGEVLGVGISRLLSLFGPMPLAITGPGLKYYDLMQASFEEPLRNNLQVRHGKMPEITLHSEQQTLVYDGNVESGLSYLDANVLAAGKVGE